MNKYVISNGVREVRNSAPSLGLPAMNPLPLRRAWVPTPATLLRRVALRVPSETPNYKLTLPKTKTPPEGLPSSGALVQGD